MVIKISKIKMATRIHMGCFFIIYFIFDRPVQMTRRLKGGPTDIRN